MIILVLKTDQQQAHVAVYNNYQLLASETWQAHRELAETLNKKIIDNLQVAGLQLHELQGIVAFKGPGSFTGLRIGLTVANALAYSLQIPIVSTMGEAWLHQGIDRLSGEDNETVALPEYGALPNITAPKH